jgi:hypothetical protein
MKKLAVVFLAVMCCVSIGGAAVPSANLFSDSYNRPNNLDIDASSIGMSGLLSPMTYVERGDDQIILNPDLTQVRDNRLYQAYGPNMSTMYLDHNFVDSQILAADGMRIGMTIIQDLGGLTGELSFVGFGVGNTLVQCQTAAFDHNGTGFRGQLGATPRAGTSDLWVGWSPINGGTIQVLKNGPTAMGGQNYNLITALALTGNDRLELELYFDDFNDSSLVTAHILWNGKVIGTDSFPWDADGLLENYIGINARQTAGYVVDDLAIEAIYNDRAQNPVPANGTVDIPAGTVNLQWNKGKDSAGNPNAGISKHYLYVTKDIFNGEPNFVSPGTAFYEVADTANPVSKSIAAAYDQTVYWRVDESIMVGGKASGPTDPNTIIGLVWKFDTQNSFPSIVGQSGHTGVFPGQTAVFTVSATSISDLHYAWYKSADNANNTPEDDTAVGADLASYTIDSLTMVIEGYYYCKVTNEAGESGAQYSVPAYLTLKRQVLRWDFEDNYLDTSGEGNHGVVDADPNYAPPTFVDDVPGVLGHKSAKFEGVNHRLKAPFAQNRTFHSGFTLTMWIRPAVVSQAVNVSVFNNNNGGPNDFQIEFNGSNLRYNGTETLFFTTATTDWLHVAVICDGTSTRIYPNLEGDDVVISTSVDTVFGHFQVGCNRAADKYYNGLIDNVQIWNYPRSYEELVMADDDMGDYYDVKQKGACAAHPLWDSDHDCKVGMTDFMQFASTWLNCGLYPQEECD